jgi:hypothetical protein
MSSSAPAKFSSAAGPPPRPRRRRGRGHNRTAGGRRRPRAAGWGCPRPGGSAPPPGRPPPAPPPFSLGAVRGGRDVPALEVRRREGVLLSRRGRTLLCGRSPRGIPLGTGDGQAQPEQAALPLPALQGQIPSQGLGQAPGEGEPQPGPPDPPRRSSAPLEGAEEALRRLGPDAHARVPDGVEDPVPRPGDLQGDLPPGGKLDRVVRQIGEDLTHPIRIPPEAPGQARVQQQSEVQPLGLRPGGEAGLHLQGHLDRVEGDRGHLQASRLDPGEVQQVREDPQGRAPLLADQPHQLRLMGVEGGILEKPGRADQRRQGRPELVSRVGDEEVLGAVRRLQGAPRLLQVGHLDGEGLVEGEDRPGVAGILDGPRDLVQDHRGKGQPHVQDLLGAFGEEAQAEPHGPRRGGQGVEEKVSPLVPRAGGEDRVVVREGPGHGAVLHQGVDLPAEEGGRSGRIRQGQVEVQPRLGEEVEGHPREGDQGPEAPRNPREQGRRVGPVDPLREGQGVRGGPEHPGHPFPLRGEPGQGLLPPRAPGGLPSRLPGPPRDGPFPLGPFPLPESGAGVPLLQGRPVGPGRAAPKPSLPADSRRGGAFRVAHPGSLPSSCSWSSPFLFLTLFFGPPAPGEGPRAHPTRKILRISRI